MDVTEAFQQYERALTAQPAQEVRWRNIFNDCATAGRNDSRTRTGSWSITIGIPGPDGSVWGIQRGRGQGEQTTVHSQEEADAFLQLVLWRELREWGGAFKSRLEWAIRDRHGSDEWAARHAGETIGPLASRFGAALADLHFRA